jgi:DNA-binding SARP family transcriptional activator/tetratricopeptide (TPR) repeat protein
VVHAVRSGEGVGDIAGMLRFEALGGVRAWRADQELDLGWPKQRAVLAVLLLRAGQVVSRAAIVDAVWGDDPPRSAANLVHTYVRRLRTSLEPDRGRRESGRVLVGSGSGYTLRLEPGQLDLDVFGDHLHRARRSLTEGDLDKAVDAFDAALALWRGTPLAAIPGPLAGTERVRLGELRVAAAEDRAEAMLSLQQHVTLTAELPPLIDEYPLRERLRGLLMLALYRSGRQVEALTVYADTRRLLVEELGIEPGPELRRLHHDILNNRDIDLPRPARGAPPRVVPRQLPPAVRHFTGRETEIAVLTGHLADAVDTGGTVVISAIDGTAGIGKTATAVHWAHRVASRFPDGQLYVNLRGFDPGAPPVTPAEAVRGFLDALDVPPQRVPADLHAQVGLYRSLIADRRVLVVLDNARDVDQVRPLLPGGPYCLAIVTSRNRLTSLVAVEGANLLSLDLFTEAEARQLLSRHLGPDRVAAEPDAVDDIIRLCARLPLALRVAAARAATHPGFPLSALAAELRDARGGLDALSGVDTATDVRAVFSWSYQTLSAESARLFRLLGLHPGPDISAAAAASLTGLPPSRVRPPLAELTRAHLVEEYTPGRYAFHDLLRAYAADLARTTDTDEQRHAATRRVLDHYLHTAYAADRLLLPVRHPIDPTPPQPGVTPEHPADRQRAFEWFAAEHAVLLAAVDHAHATGFDTHAWQLAWTLWTFLDRRGHWHDLAAIGRAAVAAARRLAEPAAQGHAHRTLAFAYTQLGRVDDAHVELGHALGLHRRIGDLVGQAYTHRSIAYGWGRQGRYAEAVDHARQAMDLFRAAGHRHRQADSLNAVGWYLALSGDYRQALAACEEALPLLQELDDRQGQAATWDSLGYTHQRLGHHSQAITCYRHAIALYRDVGDRYEEAISLARLGDTHQAAGDPDAARTSWREALVILDRLALPDADQVRAKLAKP